MVEALCHLPGPVTISELLEVQTDLAQSSTYRNLVVLEEVGVVQRIITSDDHARFELTEEITGHHHHHLICQPCGRILDVTLDHGVETELMEALSSVARANSFVGVHHRVDLVGVCDRCADQAKPAE